MQEFLLCISIIHLSTTLYSYSSNEPLGLLLNYLIIIIIIITIFTVLKLTKQEPITEIDGSIAREFFTILNNAQSYTDDQLYNIFAFSGLYSWLSSLYGNPSNSIDRKFIQHSGGSSGNLTDLINSKGNLR